ncbi:MAG: UDP-N-acetylglucosamine 2-epimerase (non-hydrolyzing) [Defluviitaleaceae bacterium]|nr:UDP-N-acetylglucosamine 2-epimerase (non-hydrolyzing) [Defluviitaleaceae bacterium]MCL2835490.1 UDP-N-acetylglucosamine 2-epimerase (non-hydrolyzing) [Defluviitaleaceae bacterium]
MDKKINIVCAFGTRPEAIKMSPLVLALRAHPAFDTKVLVTAQHRELLDSVLDTFGIVPDHDLNIMRGGQTLTEIVTKALTGAGEYLNEIRPDILLVHGDTATTFAASLAGFYAGVSVGHVEAGLRTYNKREPYPEEMNRLLTGRIADVHFAPTKSARQNLLNENTPADSIYVTGNTEIDAILSILSKEGEYRYKRDALNGLDKNGRLIVMTSHRRENLGQPMTDMCRALRRVVDENPDVTLVWPIHPNPDVRTAAYAELSGHNRIVLTDAVDTEDMYRLAGSAFMIATDSAAIQEISPILNKPCVVLRNVTERPEGVETGALMLGGNSYETVYGAVKSVLNDTGVYNRMAAAANPFGDGKASQRIVSAVLHHLGINSDRPDDF